MSIIRAHIFTERGQWGLYNKGNAYLARALQIKLTQFLNENGAAVDWNACNNAV